MVPKTIGLVVFEQVAADELTGSAQVFSRAKVFTRDAPEAGESFCYRALTLGVGKAKCMTACGVILKPQLDINDAPSLHTLIVPGGIGIQKSRITKKLARFLGRRAPITGRVVAFGSGICLLATELLDGGHVTTHWRLANELASRFFKLRVTSNSLFVRDGPFYTCAGGSAALDLSLSPLKPSPLSEISKCRVRGIISPVKTRATRRGYVLSLEMSLPRNHAIRSVSLGQITRVVFQQEQNMARTDSDTLNRSYPIACRCCDGAVPGP
jgi:putative intracellular protease/amidase